ncbi:ADP-ribose pyrophosphatase YjhB (NUDIX family) [Acidovorax soli]|uniref:ADP-ribose pyrophosphatase YjhB (NUDIX family) n=1 Tax=Acidovorax soli TaxID=592050 RepID=A0A7X0PJC9_9BURK|nr:NUDIX domain-containing protein [Acidovorax soli]MBB6563020.1 ADP-ribose pyrophosphatase YjhB (NUDIX family) [Acidovorax soli]
MSLSAVLSVPAVPAQPRMRLRAAAVIQRPGQVLLHRAEGDAFWALPGGGIEPGESAGEALVREMQEELGLTVRPGVLACVVENFFVYAGVAYHETGLYLQAHPVPGGLLDQSGGPYEGREGRRRLEFAWFAHGELAGLDLRPPFLREALGRDMAQVLHIVYRDPPPPEAPPAPAPSLSKAIA